MAGNYRYEEERSRGRGGSRRWGFGERGREDDDFEQNEGERYGGGQHYGRDYGAQGGGRSRYAGTGWEGRGRGEGIEPGRSLGGREYEGYEDEDDYGQSYGQGGRYGGSRYDQGQRQEGPWGGQRSWQGGQGYQGGGAGYSGGYGGGYQGEEYGRGYQGSGQGYGRGGPESYGGPGYWRRQQGAEGRQRGWMGNRGSMQADGWSGEPDEMRWGRQQGLYGSSEYGGYVSSQRSQRDYQSHAGKGPKGWQRSDERLREEVSEALARHPDIDASEVEVRVQNGEVTLTGTVNERRAKRQAEDIAEDVFGVKDVQNQIKVTGGLMNKLFGDRDVTSGAERESRSSTSKEGQEATTRRTTTGATSGTTNR